MPSSNSGWRFSEGLQVTSSVEYDDVQGLVRFGHGHLKAACYFLLSIKNAASARSWLGTAPVTAALKASPLPRTALQVALTRKGLEALGVDPNVIAGFSAEFIAGMASDENRSLRLGDIGANSPAYWRWGGASDIPHLLVMLFAEPDRLDSWKQAVRGQLWTSAFEEIECLSTTDMLGREAFGFIDGISQPELDWDQTRVPSVNCYETKYSNLVCLGEFLLGYRNEYQKYTDRPLIDGRDRAAQELPFAEDQPELRDLGRNGTYLVMRQLEQDVRGFWQFLDKATNSDAEQRYELGSLMVGRVLADGSPLVPLSQDAITGIDEKGGGVQLNHFTYDSDVGGTCCPYGAHIRRANPRNADVLGNPQGLISTLIRTLGFGNKNVRDDLIASTRFHRILRRGREYGYALSPEQALQPASPNDVESGLQFVALNSNLQRQFEFVQNSWLMRTKFDGLTEESDPILGNRMPVTGCPFTNTFSIPRASGIRQRITDLPQFVRVRGGAYFFLPGIRALRYLSKAGD
jgi:deferrochelatase/peroxidase EfeB